MRALHLALLLLVALLPACATTTTTRTTWTDPSAGAAVGASASQGSSEQRTYEVVVRFDDGGYGEFVYAGYAPFGPGERVVVTPGGLERAG